MSVRKSLVEPRTNLRNVDVMDDNVSLIRRIAHVALGIILTGAALLKLQRLGPGNVGPSIPLLILCVGELLLSALLIIGLMPRWTHRCAVVLFAGFAVFSIVKLVLGYEDCGCLGVGRTPPVYSASFNLAVVGTLIWISADVKAATLPRDASRFCFQSNRFTVT
jgi:hypothetical protein